MASTTDERIREFLALSLRLWQIEATIDVGDAACVARIRLEGRSVAIVVERAGIGDPFRWYLRQESDSADGTGRADSTQPRRPCGSLVGVLKGLRRMLNVDAGRAPRIAGGGR